MNKMKIGIVCYPTFGGSGVVATELGKKLADKGHEIHFITYQQPVRLFNFTANIFYHEVDVSDYPLFDYQPYELVLTSKIVDVAKHEKLDILHVHYAIPHASAAYMARAILKKEGIRLPIVTTLHGTDITLLGKDPSFEPVITFAINESDAVTAVSADLRTSTYEHFPITREVEVIPNFVCMDDKQRLESDKNLRKKVASDDQKILIHVSNFRKVKRVQDVVKVFAKVSQSINSVLLLVGDGPERSHMEKLCRDYGVWNKVHFLGKLKETTNILAIADVFLLTSETESFGLAALEAMAVGVPVVSTNTGGIPEVNEEGVSGHLHQVGDIDGMTTSVLKILKDDDTHAYYKRGALDRAKEFDVKKILPMYEKLYERLLQP